MNDMNGLSAPGRELIPLELPIDEVLERMDGDRVLLRMLADVHRRESLLTLHEMQRLVASGDSGRLEQIAHRLAGSLLVFGAIDAVGITRTIEHLAAAGNVAAARPHVALLEVELHRVNAALHRALPA